MFVYFIRRLLGIVPVLFIIITLAFFLIRFSPGNPFDDLKIQDPLVIDRLEQRYGLDQPLPVQYYRYVSGLLQGDFGPSFKHKDFTVTELIGQGFPVSLRVGLSALLLSLVLGISLGTLAALRQNTAIDHGVMALAMTGVAVPTFVLAPLMALCFAVYLGWLPVAGWNDGALRNMVMPVLAMALPYVAYIARLMRGSMIEVMRSDFIRTARAKGLPERTVVVRHAMKSALLPVMSFLGPAAAGIITGSLVIEEIFQLPGVGRYFVRGALNRDFPLVMGVIVLYASLILVFNLLVDLSYRLIDPKVEYRR